MNNDRINKNIRMMVIAMMIFIFGAIFMATVVYGIQLFAWMAVEAHDAGANIVGTFWMLAATGFAGAATLFIGALGYGILELWDGLKKVKNTLFCPKCHDVEVKYIGQWCVDCWVAPPES
jgi:hypothetical protein